MYEHMHGENKLYYVIQLGKFSEFYSFLYIIMVRGLRALCRFPRKLRLALLFAWFHPYIIMRID